MDKADIAKYLYGTIMINRNQGEALGAVHAYWKDGVDEDGTLKGAERRVSVLRE